MAVLRSTANSFGGGAKSGTASLQTAQNSATRTQQGIAAQQQLAMNQAKSNAQAASIYQSSMPYLVAPYFTGVGSQTVTPGGGGGSGASKTTTSGNGNTEILGGGGGGGSQKQQDPPKPPTASDLGVVKTPGRDVTRISDLIQQIPADTIKRIAFEQLSAIELSQVLTSNTVDGVDQKYSIISNLSEIKRRFDSSKQLSVMDRLNPMTNVYSIDIDSKIPTDAYILRNNLDMTNSYIDIDGSTTVEIEKGYIYIDTNGDLVIEFDNIGEDEIAQVQINSDGTIYEVT